MATANAQSTGMVQVTCTNGTFNVGWDNENSFFNGKGNIAALYCDIVQHSGYVSDNLSDLSLRYYLGVVPSAPVLNPVETATPVLDTPTVTPSSPVETPTSGGQNQSDATLSVVVETSTQTSQPVDSSTPVTAPQQDTSSVVSGETQTLTSESSTQTSQQETTTPLVETPLVTPPPVVEPQPVPVVAEPQPAPQPEPAPEPLPVPIPEAPQPEAPAPSPEPAPPAPEPPAPVAPEPERPAEVDNSVTPSEPAPVVQPVPTPEPLPQPVSTPEPTSQPDIAYVPPTVTLDNGVILTQEVAEQVALLQDPGELLSELFTNPAAVFAALGSVGADMSPEARAKSKDAVVQAVIVGSIVSQAAGAAAYRRKS